MRENEIIQREMRLFRDIDIIIVKGLRGLFEISNLLQNGIIGLLG